VAGCLAPLLGTNPGHARSAERPPAFAPTVPTWTDWPASSTGIGASPWWTSVAPWRENRTTPYPASHQPSRYGIWGPCPRLERWPPRQRRCGAVWAASKGAPSTWSWGRWRATGAKRMQERADGPRSPRLPLPPSRSRRRPVAWTRVRRREEVRETFLELVADGVTGLPALDDHHGHLQGHLDQGILALIADRLGETEAAARWRHLVEELDDPFLCGARWLWLVPSPPTLARSTGESPACAGPSSTDCPSAFQSTRCPSWRRL